MSIAAISSGRRLQYGWLVVGVTFLTLLTTTGAMSTPSVLLEPLQKEFGWSTATISFALSVRLAVFGVMAPFAAALMLRFGLRAIMATSAIIRAAGMLTSAAVNAPWQLTLLWGSVGGGGTGMTALVLGATVANRWFITRRGLVIGIMTASSATGQLLFLPGYAAIDSISHQGKQAGSSNFGDPVVGAGRDQVRADQSVGVLRPHTKKPEESSQKSRERFHLVGTVVSGWLSDRWSNQKLLCIYYALRGLSLIFLPVALDNSFVTLSIFAAFYGLDWFATLPPIIRLTTSTFGRTQEPLVFGWMFVAHQFGAAVAAFGAGLTRTVEGTYVPAFLTSDVLCVAGPPMPVHWPQASGRNRANLIPCCDANA
jgi:MFS family permease